MSAPHDGARAPVVQLHIGTMKSGTSYLQAVLEHQQAELAALGVRYPGNTGRAVNDVLGRRGTASLGDTASAWDELVAEIRAWTGHSVIVSMEFLALATPAQIERIVGDLRPSPVHVVLTARDIARTIPSAWQQTTKNRGTTTWPEFLDAVVSSARPGSDRAEPATDAPDAQDPTDAGVHFWAHHDIVGIVRRWLGAVDPAELTVVTVPRSGSAPAVLWRRFAEATGVDPQRVPAVGGGRGNPSLGLAEAELLRRLNGRLEGKLDGGAYRRIVTGVLSRQVLRGSTPAARTPRVPAAVADWAVQHGTAVRAELADLGVVVVGDLDELVPVATDLPSDLTAAPAVDDEEMARTAVGAAAALAIEIAGLQAQRRQP